MILTTTSYCLLLLQSAELWSHHKYAVHSRGDFVKKSLIDSLRPKAWRQTGGAGGEVQADRCRREGAGWEVQARRCRLGGAGEKVQAGKEVQAGRCRRRSAGGKVQTGDASEEVQTGGAGEKVQAKKCRWEGQAKSCRREVQVGSCRRRGAGKRHMVAYYGDISVSLKKDGSLADSQWTTDGVRSFYDTISHKCGNTIVS